MANFNYLVSFRKFTKLKMNALIKIDNKIWGKVKDFATVKELTLNSAVELLLSDALNRFGYSQQRE